MQGAAIGCLTGVALCLWIALGKAFNLEKSPWLPGGSTSGCDVSMATLNTTDSFSGNYSTVMHHVTTESLLDHVTTAPVEASL
jgi:hypothetical protein